MKKFLVILGVGGVAMIFLIIVLSPHPSSLPSGTLVGNYQATLPYGVATLVLLSDGTYNQTFAYKSGRVVKNTGTWQVMDSVLSLDNALSIGENLGAPEYGLYREYVWQLSTDKRLGQLWLTFDPDRWGWAYKKVS